MGSMPLPPSLVEALRYSDRFDYPLTPQELWFWQIGTSFSLPQVKSFLKNYSPHRSLISLRQRRFAYSQPKWLIARQVSARLSRLPTIAAIFVTGALAMDNCPIDDDIDLMLITYPHTLWLTRILVVIYLSLLGVRRPPHLSEHSSPQVSDKICDNLYLDLDHLGLAPDSKPARNLYLSHEIIQAKCLFDRFSVQFDFLHSNVWVKDYLPIAYKLHNSYFISHKSISTLWPLRLLAWLLRPLNFLCFLLQYVHMRPRISSEKIGLGYAFFHPRNI